MIDIKDILVIWCFISAVIFVFTVRRKVNKRVPIISGIIFFTLFGVLIIAKGHQLPSLTFNTLDSKLYDPLTIGIFNLFPSAVIGVLPIVIWITIYRLKHNKLDENKRGN
jgi:Cu/Ag efflux pump CusA